jgi:hypothetical protein
MAGREEASLLEERRKKWHSMDPSRVRPALLIRRKKKWIDGWAIREKRRDATSLGCRETRWAAPFRKKK